MLYRLLQVLVQSKNEAADDVLVEALALGVEREQRQVLSALLRRQTVRGLSGVVERFDTLSSELQRTVLDNIRILHHTLRECGRSDKVPLRLGALKLIALGRQGKLAYVLSENLHNQDAAVSKAATEAMIALARWITVETRRLQQGDGAQPAPAEAEAGETPASLRARLYQELIAQRPEIEAAVARALDVHRGGHGQDLLRAGLLLSDWSGSKTLAILHTAKHGGQSTMVRRLQQPPASEHVDAFLLGATHGQLRSHFGSVFSHIDEAPVLDALLRRTHWVKDHQLQLCLHQVSRGAWWQATELQRDMERRLPEDAARIGEWLAVSGAPDVVQDERMVKLLEFSRDNFDGRLRLLRIAARRKKGTSAALLRALLSDSDERLVRMAAREIVRRRPPEFENMLLQLMTNAAPSVRRVISRAIGQAGFEQFWLRFDRLDRPTRRQAGRAMVKLLPDAIQRLQRRLISGAAEQRIKAMQMTQELGLAEPLRNTLVQMCADPNPRLRSKAVSVIGEAPSVPADVLVERLINDNDPRVRANTIEVLESKRSTKFVPVLAERARTAHNRERANAIKALHSMKVGTATSQLQLMLHDPRAEHRISAMWTLRQIGWWKLLNEVGRIAKEDNNLRVRRYALGVLRNVSELAKSRQVAVAKAG